MKIFVVFVFVFFCVLSTENGFAGEAKREELKIHGKSFLIYHHPIEVVKQSASPVLILAAHAIYIPRTTADVVRSIERDYWGAGLHW